MERISIAELNYKIFLAHFALVFSQKGREVLRTRKIKMPRLPCITCPFLLEGQKNKKKFLKALKRKLVERPQWNSLPFLDLNYFLCLLKKSNFFCTEWLTLITVLVFVCNISW